MKSIGVLGCGLMGAGIAQTCAQAGYRTVVREVDEQLLDKGLERIRKFLADGVAKGKVTAEQREQTLANLAGTTRLEELGDCDLVIEAIVERVEAKREAFTALEEVVSERTIFASNTSSLCITE